MPLIPACASADPVHHRAHPLVRQSRDDGDWAGLAQGEGDGRSTGHTTVAPPFSPFQGFLLSLAEMPGVLSALGQR